MDVLRSQRREQVKNNKKNKYFVKRLHLADTE